MHQTIEAFSDTQAHRDNLLTRTDARVKFLVTLTALAAVLASRGMLLSLAMFGFSLSMLLVTQTPLRMLLWRLSGPLGIAAVICLLRATLSGTTPLAVLPLGSWKITFTHEGLREGLLVGGRVLGSVSLLVLLGSSTPAYKVFAVLRWLRMPIILVELGMLMYRYLFELLEQLLRVRDAQRVRLGYSGLAKSVSSAGTLMGVSLLRALDQATRTHEAMLVRGYSQHMPVAPLEPMRRKDRLTLGASLVVLAAGFLICQGLSG